MFTLAVWRPESVFEYWGVTIVWGLVAIALLLAAFKLFDLATPRINFSEQLNKGNIAVAVVITGFLLAAASVIAVSLVIQ